MVWYVLYALGGMAVGYFLGLRRARALKKRAVQRMNVQSLELLDARAHVTQIKSEMERYKRADDAVALALSRLKSADKVIGLLRKQKVLSDKKHSTKNARLQAMALESRQLALKATHIARKATLHLQRIDEASPVTQTIEAHEPKSYGNSSPVKVSVVDQSRLEETPDSVSKVSNRDSAILTKLHSSNEASSQ